MKKLLTTSRREFLDVAAKTVAAASASCGLLCPRALAAASATEKGKPGFHPVAACGIYCGACDVYIANLYGKRPPNGKKCHGCLSDTVTSSEIQCKVRQCAVKKDVECCAVCPSYPCNLLTEFQKQGWQKAPAANLRTIKEKGLETWKKGMKARWSCKKCGAPFSDKDKTCRKCGEPV